MPESEPKRLLLVGLPSSGKTTFLAALWHVLESEELDGGLVLQSLGVDRHYLEAIREEWLTFKTPERTKVNDKHVVSLLLQQRDGSDQIEITCPDIAGETYEEQWTARTCTEDFKTLAQDADGVLLFVHTKDRHKSPLIAEVAPAFRQQTEGNTESTVSQNIVSDPVPNQVKLVEMLQFLIELRQPNSKRVSLAIILSAWDVIDKTNQLLNIMQTPEAFLTTHVPLLSQYMTANPELFRWHVYGLSAQGGDFNTDKQLLEKITIPSERIKLLDGERITSNIMEPIQWVMR